MTFSLKDSLLYRLMMVVLGEYRASRVCATIEGVIEWGLTQVKTSKWMDVTCREGIMAKAFTDSWLCWLLTCLVNLPVMALHWLYSHTKSVWDNSFFANLVFQMGTETAIGQSWLILLLWCIPFAYWNNAYSLMAFVLLTALFYVGGMRYKSLRFEFSDIGWYWLVMLFGTGLSVVCSYDSETSWRFFWYHLSAALLVLVTVSVVQNSRDLIRLAVGAGGVVLGSSLYAVYQRIQGVEVVSAYVDLDLNEGMPGRVESFFDNPNTFAQVLILLLPLVLGLVLCSRHWFGKLVAGGVFCIGCGALAMTYGRAAWVGMAVALVMVVFFLKPRWLPLFVVLGLVCLPLLPDTIWNRILTIFDFSDTSTTSRIPLFLAAIEVIKLEPIHGAGLGTAAVQAYIEDYQLYTGTAPFVHAHNLYLQIWAEQGILALVGFLGAMGWMIKGAGRVAWNQAPSVARTMACCGGAALCGILVACLADYVWTYPRVMCIFWFVFALTGASLKICKKSENNPCNLL
ncbi:O-antigen ligase family protein [Bengtsoniella intestinalis]|uniref:O-antigen ligase family protein n=1 Tax=Bengtsoniella intestinalis TaxID=3073143 RepID=UPI00391EFA0D